MEVLQPSTHFGSQDPFAVYENDLILAELLQAEELQKTRSGLFSQPSSKIYSKVSYYSRDEEALKGYKQSNSNSNTKNYNSKSKHIDPDEEYSDDELGEDFKLRSKGTKKSSTFSKRASRPINRVTTEPLPKTRNHGKDKIPLSRKSMIQSYEERREFRHKQDNHEEYGLVTQMIGSNKLRVYCYDGIERKAQIPGKLRKVLWLKRGNIILLRKRFGQDHKADVLIKYTPDEYSLLIQDQELKTNDLCALCPQEMIFHVLSYLDLLDLPHVQRVSKLWNQQIKEAWKSKQFRENWSAKQNYVNWKLKWGVAFAVHKK